MNKGMLTVGIILLSVIALLLINVLTNYSTGSELDYYLVKETTHICRPSSVYRLRYRAHKQDVCRDGRRRQDNNNNRER